MKRIKRIDMDFYLEILFDLSHPFNPRPIVVAVGCQKGCLSFYSASKFFPPLCNPSQPSVT